MKALLDRATDEDKWASLRESAEWYRKLFENAPIGIYRATPCGRILMANPTLVRMLGCSSFAELAARNLEEIGGSDPTYPRSYFREHLDREDEVKGLESFWTRRDGSLIFVRENVKVIRDDSGKAVCYEGTIEDITERKHAEEALREREERYRQLFENANDIVFTHDLAGNYTSINKVAERITGYTSDEAPKINLSKIVAPEYLERAQLMIARKISDDVPTFYEIEIVAKDGRRIPLEVSSQLIYEKGDPVGVQGIARDITERKRAEEALRRSEERYRQLLENANDIIYTHDLNGNFTSLNKTGEKITGYAPAEAVQLNIAAVIAPEHIEHARQMTARKIDETVSTVYEVEIVAKDGRRIPVEISSRLIYEQGKPAGVQGIARDITERKQAEEALRQSEEQLLLSQKLEAVGRLAGGVAHDFNNLLTIITGYSDLVLMRIRTDDLMRPKIEEIKRAADRAAALTRQLLAFSRKQIMQPKVHDLNTVVVEMDKMLRRLIGEDIELVTLLAPTLGNVKADPGQIEQVIMNLVVNSRDAMPQGGKLIIQTSNVELDEAYAGKHRSIRPGRYLLLAISDNGSGIDAETQSHIFEPFFSTKEKSKGTGLGLATVYGIVKQSGGYVWVYSEVGQGTTFKIYLPRVDEESEELRPRAADPEPPRGSETLLLVEDESMVRNMAREVLQLNGYQVLEAANGSEALAICEQQEVSIQLMVTDVVMPQMGGPELAERLALVRPEMKVLFMSGYTDDAIVRHGMLEPGIAFLEKPFTPGALARKVREVLDVFSE